MNSPWYRPAVINICAFVMVIEVVPRASTRPTRRIRTGALNEGSGIKSDNGFPTTHPTRLISNARYVLTRTVGAPPGHRTIASGIIAAATAVATTSLTRIWAAKGPHGDSWAW